MARTDSSAAAKRRSWRFTYREAKVSCGPFASLRLGPADVHSRPGGAGGLPLARTRRRCYRLGGDRPYAGGRRCRRYGDTGNTVEGRWRIGCDPASADVVLGLADAFLLPGR